MRKAIGKLAKTVVPPGISTELTQNLTTNIASECLTSVSVTAPSLSHNDGLQLVAGLSDMFLEGDMVTLEEIALTKAQTWRSLEINGDMDSI